MKCQYCDSQINPVPENGICPNCGGILRGAVDFRLRPKWDFPEPPVGVYKDVAGYIEIGKESVTFYRNQWPFAPRTRRTIPYRELYAVSFGYGKALCSGFLCVREWQDRHLPLPSEAADIVYDETSVYFRKEKNEEFFTLYQFLRQCADIVRSAQTGREPSGQAALLGKYKGFYGYMELGEDVLRIYKKALWYPPTERVIPYSEIAEVAFREATTGRDGGLSVRARTESKDMSAALRSAISDETSIDFSKEANGHMRKIYAFLVDYVRENTRRWTE